MAQTPQGGASRKSFFFLCDFEILWLWADRLIGRLGQYLGRLSQFFPIHLHIVIPSFAVSLAIFIGAVPVKAAFAPHLDIITDISDSEGNSSKAKFCNVLGGLFKLVMIVNGAENIEVPSIVSHSAYGNNLLPGPTARQDRFSFWPEIAVPSLWGRSRWYSVRIDRCPSINLFRITGRFLIAGICDGNHFLCWRPAAVFDKNGKFPEAARVSKFYFKVLSTDERTLDRSEGFPRSFVRTSQSIPLQQRGAKSENADHGNYPSSTAESASIFYKRVIFGTVVILFGSGFIGIALKIANKSDESPKMLSAAIAVGIAGALLEVHGLFFACLGSWTLPALAKYLPV